MLALPNSETWPEKVLVQTPFTQLSVLETCSCCELPVPVVSVLETLEPSLPLERLNVTLELLPALELVD
jgi:hypothetical protein